MLVAVGVVTYVGLLAFALWAASDAAKFPESTWKRIGRSKTFWVVGIYVVPIAALGYFDVRRELIAARERARGPRRAPAPTEPKTASERKALARAESQRRRQLGRLAGKQD